MIVIEWIRGYCPVQAVGTIDGLPFYFRARDDKWSLSIAQTPDVTDSANIASWQAYKEELTKRAEQLLGGE